MVLLTIPLLLLSSVVGQSICADHSGCSVHMVEVEPGISVEVLECSSEGPSLLFLAALGNTAHVYDQFIHHFTDRYRVLAMTRRGFGRSAQPAAGYTTDRLAEDIKVVLDNLKIDKAVLLGHSIAGEEMTRFAVQHPSRTAALVYLDSAYDHTQAISLMQETPPPASSPPSRRDSRSIQSYAAYWARTNVRLPIAEICATSKFDSDGEYLGNVTPGSVVGALISGLRPPEFSSVKVPTLAIYSVDRPPDQDFPYYYELDEEGRSQAERFVRLARSWSAEQRRRLRHDIPQAIVRELVAADHYLFVSHEGHVASEVSRFLDGKKEE